MGKNKMGGRITRQDCLRWIEKPNYNPITGRILTSEKMGTSWDDFYRTSKKFGMLPFSIDVKANAMKKAVDNHTFIASKKYKCGSMIYRLYAMSDAHGDNTLISEFVMGNISNVFHMYITQFAKDLKYNAIDHIMSSAFASIESEVEKRFPDERSGATLLCVLFFENRFVIGNIGDTKAIVLAPVKLSKNPHGPYIHDNLIRSPAGKTYKDYYTTPEHSISNPYEKIRVKTLNGEFTTGSDGRLRLGGYTRLTRTLGDMHLRLSQSGIGLISKADISQIFNFSYDDMRKAPIKIIMANDEFWRQNSHENVLKYLYRNKHQFDKKFIDSMSTKEENKDIVVTQLSISSISI